MRLAPPSVVVAVTIGVTPPLCIHAQVRANDQPIASRMAALQSEIPVLLSSPDPVDATWGAWLAGQQGLTELQPSLEALLRSPHPRGHATLYAMDALIQLKAPLTADLLASLSANHPLETLVLASHSGESGNEVLLSLMDRRHGPEWFGAANLLLPRRPPGLAARLLRHVTIDVDVTVSDSGTVSSGRGSASGGKACGFSYKPSGLPPWPVYEITDRPRASSAVLSLGPRPIYYERRLADGPPSSEILPEPASSSERLRYLAVLLRTERLPVGSSESLALKWRPRLDVAAATAVFQADVEARYRRVLSTLVARRLLTDAEAAALPPTLSVSVRDLHGQKRP